ncbi:phage tail tape measure protein [Frankia sp. AvcI1]|uniref:phage tail tape measure protein n=1 Tax=Frankia sp. AvcI1 TaxID=573496 RepID=UPI002117AC0D|nr:phage tail tape measure protein [Frankia sp. AvcI1]
MESAAAAISQLDAAAVAGATSVSRLGAAGTAAARGAERIGTAATAAAAGLERLDAVAAASVVGIEALGTAAAAAATEVGGLRTALTQVATRVERLAPAVVQLAPSLLAFGAAADAASAGTGRLAETTTVAAGATARLDAAAAAGAATQRAAAASSAASAAAISRVGTAAGGTVAQAARMEGAVAGSATAMGRLGTVGQAAQTGLMVVGVALIAAAAGAVKFEASMHNVASIDSQVQASFKETSQAVINMSKELPQSANTLAAGLYNVASSGFYGADAMHILETSAVAASAGLTTTDTASKAIVASLNAYHLTAADAGRVSDALFNTVNYGVISFEELTGAIAHSVGNAAKANVSIEQLGAGLATMTLSGMSASEAGVSMNNVLSKLIKPSTALSQTAVQLGINLQRDLADPAVGLSGVMLKLGDASNGSLRSFLAWFPEIRAARGALALVAGEGENYKRIIGEMGTAQANAGATMRTFNEQAKSTKHELEMLGNQVAAAGLELGMAMLPGIERAVGGLESFGSKIKAIGLEVAREAAPGFRDLGTAIGNVVDIARDLQLDQLIGLAGKIGIGVLVEGFNQLGGALKQATGFLADNRVAVMAVVAAYAMLRLEAIVTGVYNLAAAIVGAGIGAFNRFDQAVMRAAESVRAFGGGNLAAGFVAFSASAAVATAGIYLVAEAFQEAAARARDLAAVREQVAQVLKPVDGTTLASFQQARDRLTEMTESARRQVEAGGDLVNNTLHLGVTMREVGIATEELNQRQIAMTTNTRNLAAEFHMSEAAVTSIAQKYNIDLSQGMATVDGRAVSLSQRFQDVVSKMLGAGLSAEQAKLGMAALDIASGGADQAVKDLTATLNLFAGYGLGAQQSADAFATAINGITDKSALATTATGGFSTALTGNSNEAIKNRGAIMQAITAAEQHATAVTQLTNDTAQGTAAFQEHKQAIIDAATAAGLDKTQVEALIDSLNMIPNETTAKVIVDGAKSGKADVDDLRNALASIPKTSVYRVQVEREYYSASSPNSPAASFYASGGPIGGQVTGPGTGTSDSVPIMASNGEWVINSRAAGGYGSRAMAAVNAGAAQIIIPSGYATGGPVGVLRGYAAGGTITPNPIAAAAAETAAGPASTGGGSDPAGRAVQLIASGATTLADVYANAAAGVGAAARAMRELTPRLWQTNQNASTLTGTTSELNTVLSGWVGILAAATTRTDGQRLSAAQLGQQMLTLAVGQVPQLQGAQQLATLASQAATIAQEAQRTGAVNLGAVLTLAGQTILPALTSQTGLHTAASGANTTAVQLATTASGLMTQAITLGTQTTQLDTQTTTVATATRDLGTASTTLSTQATDLNTESVTAGTQATVTGTAATTENTTAVNTSTASLGEQTTATNTGAAATTAFTGVVTTNSGSLNENAGAASAAAAAVRDYAAALAAVPANVTTTVTTNYVTTGTPAAAGGGFAVGGRISGPGTGTSDDVPIMASHGEWIIRAAAAAHYGDGALAAVNAGTARIVHGGATAAAAYAGGGRIGHYASGGMVRGDWTPMVVNAPVTISAPVTITLNGGDAGAGTVTAVEQAVDRALGRLADRIGARPGRGR